MGKGFNISRWGIEHGSFTLFLLIVAACMGVMAFFTLGQKEDPDFTIRTMAIDVRWPGASADEMERQVVDKIEEKVQQTPHLEKMRSYTKEGHAIIFVSLDENLDSSEIKSTWYQVRKKISDIKHTLPPGVLGPFFNDEFGDTYIGLYGLSGVGYSYAQLRDEAKLMRDRILAVKNAEKVDILGGQQEQIYIELSDMKLAQYGLTMQMIQQSLQGSNEMFAQGSVSTGTLQIPLRVDGTYKSISDIEDTRFNLQGRVFRLGDIATVRRGYNDPYTYKVRVNGEDSVLVCVTMTEGANVIDVGKGVDKALAQIRTELPKGMVVTEVSNQSHVVKDYVSEFQLKLGMSVCMVLLVSFFSLGFKTGVVVALAVPLVLAITFAVMNQLGISFQRVSLGAIIISLGLLVDDAMVTVEMMKRKIEEGWEKKEAATYAYTTVAFPMLTGTLITVAGFLSIGLAQSSTGEYVRSLFIVVGTAVTTSWFVAVYFTPYIGCHLLKEQPHNKGVVPFQTPFFCKLRIVIDRCMRHRRSVIGGTIVLFLVGVAALPFLPKQFFPYSDSPVVMVDIWLPEGTDIHNSEARARQVESFIAGQPGIESYTTYVGAGAPRFYLPLDQQLSNTNLAQIVVRAESVKVRDGLLVSIADYIDNNVPGVRYKVERLNLGPPVGWPVNIRISGPDSALVRKFADRMKEIVKADPRTFAVHDDWHEEVPVVSFNVDQGRLLGMGLNSQVVKLSLQTEFSGAPMGYYREGEELLPIIVRRPEAERGSIDKLMGANIPTATGLWVPISQVADWKLDFEPGVIWRRNRMPTITVQANIPDTCQPKDVINELYTRMADMRKDMPAGYKMEMGGAVEESAKAESSVYKYVPLTALLMIFLLMVQMGEFKPSIMVLCCAPLGIIGASLALFLTNKPFGFVVILGVIALAGMIMRNAIILVDQIQQNMAAGQDSWNAVVEATVSRFRPIMLTATADVLAFMTLTTNAFWGPMAIAMTGGLIFATVLIITFVPALYVAWFGLNKTAPNIKAVVETKGAK
jgi:multidrug efflux pump